MYDRYTLNSTCNLIAAFHRGHAWGGSRRGRTDLAAAVPRVPSVGPLSSGFSYAVKAAEELPRRATAAIVS